MIGKLAAPFRKFEFGGYFTVSMVALAVDMATLLVVAQFVHYLWAATLAFAVGAVTSYVLAIRWVFAHRRFAKQPVKEFGAYTLVGIAGLGINNIAIFLAIEVAACGLPFAKMFAAGATFLFNFMARKLTLFTR